MRGEGREKLLQTAIFSERQELTTRSRPTTPAPRKTPSTQWLKGSEWEWEGVGRRGIEWEKWRKHFVYSGFSSRPQQVSNWERWQCSLLVDEWHLRRLSILLLLLELSKLSKLCLSISQILAWPPVSTTKLRTSSDLENFFWQLQGYLHFFKLLSLFLLFFSPC